MPRTQVKALALETLRTVPSMPTTATMATRVLREGRAGTAATWRGETDLMGFMALVPFINGESTRGLGLRCHGDGLVLESWRPGPRAIKLPCPLTRRRHAPREARKQIPPQYAGIVEAYGWVLRDRIAPKKAGLHADSREIAGDEIDLKQMKSIGNTFTDSLCATAS